MDNQARCRFTEGSILLPEGYQEQTVNILIAPEAPALNISRDQLIEGGLAGGLNLYQYAPNPVTCIDPWGLTNVTVCR